MGRATDERQEVLHNAYIKITIQYCAIWCKIIGVLAPQRLMSCVSQHAPSLQHGRLLHACSGAEVEAEGD